MGPFTLHALPGSVVMVTLATVLATAVWGVEKLFGHTVRSTFLHLVY